MGQGQLSVPIAVPEGDRRPQLARGELGSWPFSGGRLPLQVKALHRPMYWWTRGACNWTGRRKLRQSAVNLGPGRREGAAGTQTFSPCSLVC